MDNPRQSLTDMKRTSKPAKQDRERLAFVNDIKIHCPYDELALTATLQPNPRNPNGHPRHQLELMAKIFRSTGLRKPIVVSNLSGMIVTGHGTWEACKLIGMERVPVSRQDYADPAEELAHLLADNELAELSEVNEFARNLLKNELANQGGFDLELAGFLASPPNVKPVVQEVNVQPLPTMAWALIGVPIHEFGKLTKLTKALPANAVVHTTVNNDENGQP